MLLFLFLSFFQIKFIASLPFLCQNRTTTDDLNCTIEMGDYRQIEENATSNLTIVEYNIDKNAYGGDSPYEQGIDFIISLMNGQNSSLPTPDVLIMSELARDCQNYGNYINGPKLLAEKLGYSYAYVVEYIEETNEIDHQCTTGNAIFSRFQLKNIGQLRFNHQCCKYSGRWGGRISVFGDLEFNDRVVTFYSTHLESGQNNVIDILESIVVRVEQIKELINHANTYKKNSNNILISGDFNAPLGDMDPVNIELLFNGYDDSHSSLDYFDRDTCPFDTLSEYDIFIFDYIWATGKSFSFNNPIICNQEYSKDCYGASDHSPIMVTLSLI